MKQQLEAIRRNALDAISGAEMSGELDALRVQLPAHAFLA